jgi:signal transduction histidine kinase
VLIDYRAGEVALRVCNPLPGGASPVVAAPPGAGAGLIGMRERAALVQGRFAAGPDPGGHAWRVEAQLPTGDGPP